MFAGILLVDVHARVCMYVRVWVHVVCMRARVRVSVRMHVVSVFVYMYNTRCKTPPPVIPEWPNILCTYSR